MSGWVGYEIYLFSILAAASHQVAMQLRRRSSLSAKNVTGGQER